MDQYPTFEELASRIQKDIDFFEGNLPERFAIAWSGYLASLIEWGLISIQDHYQLIQMLPFIEDNPATAILTGR
jgi:hypothetical protein